MSCHDRLDIWVFPHSRQSLKSNNEGSPFLPQSFPSQLLLVVGRPHQQLHHTARSSPQQQDTGEIRKNRSEKTHRYRQIKVSLISGSKWKKKPKTGFAKALTYFCQVSQCSALSEQCPPPQEPPPCSLGTLLCMIFAMEYPLVLLGQLSWLCPFSISCIPPAQSLRQQSRTKGKPCPSAQQQPNWCVTSTAPVTDQNTAPSELLGRK